ncbi:unnamed protein product [Blepharisma stoltei]|uniref:Uncharacterized protein n=1 Tax=Blepharisma stoltei TaxID=1481888 RepID=A0AAU9IXB2_9CILI|nr:unnamed protein product [Blepharisma stoltei]
MRLKLFRRDNVEYSLLTLKKSPIEIIHRFSTSFFTRDTLMSKPIHQLWPLEIPIKVYGTSSFYIISYCVFRKIVISLLCSFKFSGIQCNNFFHYQPLELLFLQCSSFRYIFGKLILRIHAEMIQVASFDIFAFC